MPAEQTQNPADVMSVSAALRIAKRQLEEIRLTIEGEISEFSDKPGYKAVYFTLTDADSALPCLIWKNDFAKCNIELRQGMLVQISGTFSLYAAKGRMNFAAKTIKLAGEGDLRMKVAALAKKLEKEGLMAASRKKSIPKFVSKIAVVTSPRGKAIHDVIRTLRRRSKLVEVYVCGVAVEGDIAPDAICRGLQVADESDADVILLVRGGGSYEDLMPFNDEKVARMVAACKKPVVTGIGHEPDNSIADMVGDLRCSTPTAAAEATTVDTSQLSTTLDEAAKRMSLSLTSKLERYKERLSSIASRPIFHDPNALLMPFAIRLDSDAERLSRAIPGAIQADKSALQSMQQSLVSVGQHLLDRQKNRLAVVAARIDDLSPLAILSRGYCATYDEQGYVISSKDQVRVGDKIDVMISDGTLGCVVESIKDREQQ